MSQLRHQLCDESERKDYGTGNQWTDGGDRSEGYLANLSDWAEDVAEFLAAQDKLTLDENHWKIINYMREYFNEYGTAPNLRILQKGLKDEFGPEWATRNSSSTCSLRPAKQAGRYAGTPKPTGCV